MTGVSAAARELPYMAEPWFGMLKRYAALKGGAQAARALGVSAPLIYQVLRGTGEYGKGKASTARIADRVLHQLGSYECPHLTEQHDAPRIVTSDECRGYAHRQAPTSSPRDLAHWQACRKCPHFTAAAPPEARPVVPRKTKAAPGGAQPQPQGEAS